MAFAKLIK